LIPLLFFIFPHKKYFLMGFFLLILIMGVSRYQMKEFEIKNIELRNYNDLEKEVSFQGRITEEPDVRGGRVRLEVQPEEFEGRVLVTVEEDSFDYGDKIKITGNLLTPKEFEDFNYKRYLEKEGIYSVMYSPKVEKISSPGFTFYGSILSFKERLRDSVNGILFSPHNYLLNSMILGDKAKMPPDLQEKLNVTGLRHVTAISGMHIVILTGILMSLFLGLGLWRNQSFYLTILVISLFIVMTGVQTSAVRAGFMGGAFLLAQKIGRTSRSSHILAFIASVMLFGNPLLLRYDISFQLSFLAVMGIIYLGPVFSALLGFIPEGRFFNLKSILVMTFSAQLFTLPVLIYNFGLISVISPLSNALVLPVVPWIMIFGGLFAFLTVFLGSTVGLILSFPVWFFLSYLTKVIDFLSSFPFSSVSFEISPVWLIVSYVVIISFFFFIKKKYTGSDLFWVP